MDIGIIHTDLLAFSVRNNHSNAKTKQGRLHMIHLKRILVPTDFSKHSHNALRYAAAFARRFEAEIHLLHVFQDLAVSQPEAVTVGPPIVAPIEQFLASAQASLERLIQENQLTGIAVHPTVRTGSPFDEIVQFAKEQNIDLIV